LPEVGPFTPAQWEAWLDAHHESESEAWLVSWKKSTGRQELSYGDAVEIATAFGWVDSLEKSIDSERYKLRWTPRRPGGNWTERNRELAERLLADGRMRPAGLRAFEAARRTAGDSPRGTARRGSSRQAGPAAAPRRELRQNAPR
jgi:uncharacterized protein YdeI (YjbR/CyaY-like superfamily)